MNNIKRIVSIWFLIAIIITIISGMIYAVEQQNLRLSANDPQIQMAEDAANAIENGQTVDAVVPKTTVDITKSLSPFIVVFDNSKKAVASSGIVGSSYPTLPNGVFDYVAQHGEDRITWVPVEGTRIAAVVVKYSGKTSGYILAGRSLREVEKRVNNITQVIGFAWICSLIIIFVVLVGSRLFKEGKGA